MIRQLLAAACFFALAVPVGAAAHDVDVTSVARVFLDELQPGHYSLSIVDTQVPPIRDPGAVLPTKCAVVDPLDSGYRISSGFAFQCEGSLTFEDELVLPWPLAGVVVVARWSDGSEASAYFRGEGGSVPVALGQLEAEARSIGHLAGTYFVLGVEHILFGIDHLLFVLGLLLLVRGTWPLVKTITSFTVAHSLTLGAAVLGLVPVRTGPVEAAIALSIVLLAREVVVGQQGRTSLVHRKPWLVAFAFGLLHGLGFAGALGEIGLRSADIPLALLAFNVGVEAGQLAFVGVLLLAYVAFGRLIRTRLPKFEPALGYALGALAMFWLVERLPAVWSV